MKRSSYSERRARTPNQILPITFHGNCRINAHVLKRAGCLDRALDLKPCVCHAFLTATFFSECLDLYYPYCSWCKTTYEMRCISRQSECAVADLVQPTETCLPLPTWVIIHHFQSKDPLLRYLLSKSIKSDTYTIVLFRDWISTHIRYKLTL